MASTDSSLFAYSADDEHHRKEKAPGALRTISEASEMLEVPQHVLRFWETKFNQIKPLKRNGGRRFYRPQDLDILQQIKHLLYAQGYTIKGAKKAIDDFTHGKHAEWLTTVPPASVNDNAPDSIPLSAEVSLAAIAEALAEPKAPAVIVPVLSQPTTVDQDADLRRLRSALLAARAELASALKVAA